MKPKRSMLPYSPRKEWRHLEDVFLHENMQ